MNWLKAFIIISVFCVIAWDWLRVLYGKILGEK